MVFKYNLSTGELMRAVDFTGASGATPGTSPYASLTPDGLGSLWGTTRLGGSGSAGTVNRVAASNAALTTVAQFPNTGAAPVGSYPVSGLTLAAPGIMLRASGGALNNIGTVFRINRSNGVLSTVVNFTGTSGAAPGANPAAGLIFAGGNFLWGTNGFGGNGTNFGTIFKFDPSTDTVTTIVSFSDNGPTNKGKTPQYQLLDDGGGFLLGTTTVGGGSFGTLFRINKSTGGLTTLAQFTGNGAQASSGVYPNIPIHQDTDGGYHGVTTTQGPGGGGTIFPVRFGPTPVTPAVSGVTYTTATLNGNVNPNNTGNTTVSFEYGTSATLAGATAVPALPVGNGSTPAAVAVPLTRLVTNTPFYFRIIAGNAGSASPQAGIILSFTTPNPTPLAAWKFANLGDYAAPDLGDPDGDGLPNLIEYAFGYLPQAPNPGGLPIVGRDGSQLTLTYPKSKTATDFTILVEVSSDLTNWTNAPAEVQQFWQLIDGDTTQRVTARDLTASPPGARRFMRVRVAR